MIFAHTLDKVLSGEKSQTRRLRKPKEDFFPEDLGTPAAVMHRGFSAYRLMWEVGKIYAVQPGRGKPAVARIRIIDIRCEDVREINDTDVRAEGFDTIFDFWAVWTSMHDKVFYRRWKTRNDRGSILDRPSKFYIAWALTFELVR